MIRTISPQDMREMERAFLEGTGYPSILLMEHAAQARLEQMGGGRILLSLSHEGDTAIAFALIQ